MLRVWMNVNNLWTCLTFLLIFFNLYGCIGQIYTSTHYLELLSKEEGRLVKALTTYVEKCKTNSTQVSDDILRFLEKVKTARCNNSDDRSWAEHPINSYHLIKRIVIDWTDVYSAIWCETCSPTYAAMDLNISLLIAKRELNYWPTHGDISGVIGGIFRLWRIYKLDIDDIIGGKILTNQTVALSTSDVMRFTRYADDRGMFYEEIVWLETLIQRRLKINMGEKDPLKANVSITRALAGAYYKYGMPWKSVEILQEILDKGDKGLMNNFKFYSERLLSVPVHKRMKKLKARRKLDLVHRRYESLCRGDVKSPKQLARLRCYNRKMKTSYLRTKEEIINIKPRIVIFHDMLSAKETEFLRHEGVKEFERSMTYSMDEKENDPYDDEYRISQSGWLKDTEHPLLMNISRRISSITGLDTTFRELYSSVEQYQVANYGVGGMYRPHTDNLIHPYLDAPIETSDETAFSGERLATWMFYLNTLEAGGATVFPLVKARATVTEGSAVFWYNIYPDGTLDSRLLHAGCPVLLGSKWVTNKWIRQYGNELKRPCGLTEDAEFKFE